MPISSATIDLPSWVYLHYPVCQHHCSYCDFNVVSQSLVAPNFEERWLSAIDRHLTYFAGQVENRPIKSLYLGGGTPSLMSIGGLQKLFGAIARVYQPSVDFEFTIECNPENLREEYLKGLKDLGVNRLSLGLQSTVPGQLRRLERLATHKNIYEALEGIQKIFSNFSVDLMIGIPDQTELSLETDLEFLRQLQAPHVSIYLLTLASDHKWRTHPSLRDRIAGPDFAGKLYARVCELMRAEGYLHYEVSNFAKPGFESRHNRNYWDATSDYLGLGAGAHGYLKNKSGDRLRYETEKDIRIWSDHDSGVSSFETLTSEQRRMESLYLSLRSRRPVPSTALRISKLPIFKQAGLIEEVADGVVLTEAGWLMMETIASELLL